jgi:hypothetical protein
MGFAFDVEVVIGRGKEHGVEIIVHFENSGFLPV